MWWDEDYWISRDGTRRRPVEMDLQHLQNCIAMVNRNMEEYYDRYRRRGQSLSNFRTMIQTSRIYTLLQENIRIYETTASRRAVTTSNVWGTREGGVTRWEVI